MMRTQSFFTAPFAVDGEMLGLGEISIAQLSPKWLGVCGNIIGAHGDTFRVSLGQALSHLEIQLTASRGAGLGTFFANSEIVVSTAYLRGTDRALEQVVLSSFVDSINRTTVGRQAGTSPSRFWSMLSISQRPLQVVIAWGNPQVSTQDAELVRELATHFAAAFLCQSGDQ